MKKLLVLSLFLASCESSNQDNNSGDALDNNSGDVLARISFRGSCTDKEIPSKHKPIDTYEAEGFFNLLENDSFGFISATSDEMKKRFDTELNDNLDEWMAITDIPEIDIYEIPSKFLNGDQLNIPATHNYDDTGETRSIYANRKAECSLKIESIEGVIPASIFEKESLCFSLDCSLESMDILPIS